MPTARTPAIYVSYAPADTAIASACIHAAEHLGLGTLYGWPPEVDWPLNDVIKSIGLADWVLFVWSAQAAQRARIDDERAQAIRLCKRLVVVRLDQTPLPMALQSASIVDITSSFQVRLRAPRQLEGDIAFDWLSRQLGRLLGREYVKTYFDDFAALSPRTLSDKRTDFAAAYPSSLIRNEWAVLRAYVFSPSAAHEVNADLKDGTHLSGWPLNISMGVGDFIARGTTITVSVTVPDVTVVPSQSQFVFIEDWHRLDFQLQYHGVGERSEVGEVAFHVGLVCVARVFFATFVAQSRLTADTGAIVSRARPYERIFVCHSHEDIAVVESLEAAYAALGLEYLRDVKKLRAGETWDPALLRMIERADTFQLCWSSNAKQSAYVEREWRHAVGLDRADFIRPVYWEEPMPAPPPELSAVHFARLAPQRRR